jgi:proteasome lid subunit RPN8/RPN11
VGAFGLARADDLLYVEELRLVRQRCTAVSVSFDDAAVAEFFDEQVDCRRMPEQFARIWVHTHPGNCPLPSQVDEETFDRVFGRCDWAVMFILAKEGQTYCRLQFRQGPGGAFEIPVRVDFEREFGQSDHQAWAAEFDTAVSPEAFASPGSLTRRVFLEDADLLASDNPFDEAFDADPFGKDPFFHEQPI